MLRRYKVTGIGNPKPPKKRKQFLMLLLALVVTVPALSLLKTSVLADNKNIINVDSDTYNITADLGDGTFTPGSKPEFNKMPNGKWLYKYKPTDREVALPIPTNEGYRFTGWYVEQSQTPNPDYKIPKWNNKNIEVRAGWEVLNSTLVPGPTFNQKIKAMPNYNSIRRINFMVGTPSPNGIDLSVDSNKAITATVTGDTLNVKCTGIIFTNRNCDRMFRDFVNITDITFDNFNTSKAVTMHDMFCASGIKDGIDLTKLDTSNVTDMFGMFYSCKNLTTLDITSFNTAKLQNMGLMFADSTNLKTVKMTGLNLDNVSVIRHLFKWCRNLNHIDLSEYKFLRVAEMSQMFWDCEKLSGTMTINSNVTKYDGMFENCSSDPNSKFIVKYKDARTKEVARRMVATKNPGDHVYLWEKPATLLPGPDFRDKIKSIPNYKNITTINFNKGTVNPDGIDFSESQDGGAIGVVNGNTLNITCEGEIFANRDSSHMFELEEDPMFNDPNNLESINFNNFNTSNVDNMSNMFSWCQHLRRLDLSKFDTSNVSYMNSLFYGCRRLSFLDISKFSTGGVYDMGGMFGECLTLTSLDLSHFRTTYVKEMGGMFIGCSSLTHLNLTNFNTENVTNMTSMFKGCSKLNSELTIGQTDWIIKYVDYNYMFEGCSSDPNTKFIVKYVSPEAKELAKNMVATKNIGDRVFLYEPVHTLLNGDDFNYVLSRNGMLGNSDSIHFIKGAVPSTVNYKVDVSSNQDGSIIACRVQNTSGGYGINIYCTDIIYANPYCDNMFKNAWAKEMTFDNFDMSKVISSNGMFSNIRRACGELTIPHTNITNYTDMFRGCSSDPNAKFIVKYVSPETKELARNMVNTKNPEDHVYLYEESSTLLPGPEFNKKINAMSGYSSIRKINFLKGTPNPDGIDLSEKQDKSIIGTISGDTLNISCNNEIFANSDASEMFSNLSYVTSIKFDNFNTSDVTNMNAMFAYCSHLMTLNLNRFNTSKVTCMSRMFRRCNELVTLDLSNFDTSNVDDMRWMFQFCISITNLNLTSFNTENVTKMGGMFERCFKLRSLDLSNFNTSNVTDMGLLFEFCESLTNLNVSSFDMSKVTYAAGMFNHCKSLTNLDLSSFNISNVRSTNMMFYNCSKLNSELTIPHTDITNYTYMFEGCSSDPNAKFIVKYKDAQTKEIARNMVNTKNQGDHVYLYGEEPKSYTFNDMNHIIEVKVDSHDICDVYLSNDKYSSNITVYSKNTPNSEWRRIGGGSNDLYADSTIAGCRLNGDKYIKIVYKGQPTNSPSKYKGSEPIKVRIIYRDESVTLDSKPSKSTAPKPVTVTLHNGVMAQTQEEKRLIQHGVIGYLGNPELNPQYSGVFGGYYYDQDCTRPVKPTDPIAQDTDLYARW